jgi:hypothetical protein
VGLGNCCSRSTPHALPWPPGVGKTMLAERVPGLLPDLALHDSLEVSAVHSLAGFNLADKLISRPPYSDPHHSASVVSIVGGGQRMARPGAISCAHARVSLCSREARPLPDLYSTSWMMMPIGLPPAVTPGMSFTHVSKNSWVLPRCPRLSSARSQRVPGLGDARLVPSGRSGTAA